MSKRSSQSPRAKAHTLAASPSSKKMKNRTTSKLLNDDESFLSSNLANAYLHTNNNKNNNNAPSNNQNEHLMLMSDLDLEDSVTLMSPIRPVSRSITAGSIAEGSYFKAPATHDSNYMMLQVQLAKAMDEMSHLRYSWNSEMESRSLLEQKNRELTHELEMTRENCTQMKSELENFQTLSSRLLLKHDNQEERLQQVQAKASTLEKQLADSERTVAQLKSINEQYANSHSEKAKQLWLEKEKMLLDNINDLKDKNSLARKEISRLQEDNENISYQLEAKKKRIVFLEEEQAKLTAQQSETLLLLASLEKSIKENNSYNKNTDASEPQNPKLPPHSPGKDAEGPTAATNAATVVLETKVLALESDKKFLEDRLTLLETQLLEQQKQQFQQQQQQQQQLQQQFQTQWQSLQQQQQQHQEVLLAAVSRPVSAPSYPRHPVSGLVTGGISPLATNNPNSDNNPVVAQTTTATVPPSEDIEFSAKPLNNNTTRANANNTATFPNIVDYYNDIDNFNGRNVIVHHPHRAHSFDVTNPMENLNNNGPRQQFQIPPLNIQRSANNITTGNSNYSPYNNNLRYNATNVSNNSNKFPDNNMYNGNKPVLRNPPPNNWVNSPQAHNANSRNMDTYGQQMRPQSSPSRANTYNHTMNSNYNNAPNSPIRNNLMRSPINKPMANNINPTANVNANHNSHFDHSLGSIHNPSSPSMSNRYNNTMDNRINLGTESKQVVFEADDYANNIVNDIYPLAEVDHEHLSQNTSAVLPPADVDVDEGVPNEYHPSGDMGDNVPYDSSPAHTNENKFHYIHDYEQDDDNANMNNGYYENNATRNRSNMNANARTNHMNTNNMYNNNINRNNNMNNDSNNNRIHLGRNRSNNGPIQQRPQPNNYNNNNSDNFDNNYKSHANYTANNGGKNGAYNNANDNNINNNNYCTDNASMNATNNGNRNNRNNNIINSNTDYSGNNSQKGHNINNAIDNTNAINANNMGANPRLTRSRGTTAEDIDAPLLSPSEKPTSGRANNIDTNNITAVNNPKSNNNNTANNVPFVTGYPTNSTSAINYTDSSTNNHTTISGNSNNNTSSNNDGANNANAAGNTGFRIVRRDSTRANTAATDATKPTTPTAAASSNSNKMNGYSNMNNNNNINSNTAANNDSTGMDTTSSKNNRPLTQNSLRRLSSRYMQPGETTESSKNRLLQEKAALKKQIMDFMKQFVKEHNRQPTKEERDAGAGKLAKEYRTISKVIEEIDKGTITSDMNPSQLTI